MLEVRVQPGAKRAGLKGWLEDGALRLAVTAPAEGGRANDAVITLLAESLYLRPRDLSVRRGASSRSKWIEIGGLDAAEARRRIDRALEGARAPGDEDASRRGRRP